MVGWCLKSSIWYILVHLPWAKGLAKWSAIDILCHVLFLTTQSVGFLFLDLYLPPPLPPPRPPTLSHTIFHTIFVTHHLHPPPLCVAGVALMALRHRQLLRTPSLSHNFVTPSFTRIFHTQLCDTPSLSHTTIAKPPCHSIFRTQLCHTTSLSHSIFHTHLSQTPLSHTHTHTTFSHTIFDTTSLSHTIFHTHLCLTPSLSHAHVSHTIFVTRHLCHTPSFTQFCHIPSLSRTIFRPQLCHTPSLSQTIFHTQLCHTIFVTHNLSHICFTRHLSPTTLWHATWPHSHTNLHMQVFKWSITASFIYPSFPIPLDPLLLLIGRSWLVGLSGPFFSLCTTIPHGSVSFIDYIVVK